MRLMITGGLLLGLWGGNALVARAQTTIPVLPPLVSSTEALRTGVALHDEGKFAEAIARYRAVPSSDTSYAQVQSELALSYYANKQYAEAIAAGEQALLLGQQEPQTYNTVASAQEELVSIEAALATYQRGLQQYPYSALLWYNQALTYNKANQPAGALSSLQRSLELQPTHAFSHLVLGQLAARQGQTAHAMLGIMTFLALEPTGDNSNAVLALLEQLASGTTAYEDAEKLPATFANTRFEELDQLLDARIALKKDYTTPVKFDASLVKQLQLLVEKYPAPAATPDLWQRTYDPLVQVLRNQEARTAFTYLILSSANDAGGRKWVKSNKTKVAALQEQVVTALRQLGTQQPVARPGYPTQLKAWFDENGSLYGLGEGTEGTEGPQGTGPWLLVSGGAISGEGRFGANHQKTGPWRYFYSNGQLEKSVSYNAEGELEGESREFYDTGALSAVGTYRAGKLNGRVTVHKACGAVSEARQYKDGELDGTVESFYSDGKLQARSTYRAGLKQGQEMGYYPDGTLEYEYTFVDDRRQGPFVVYYRNKQVETRGTYDFSEKHGAYATFFDNGKPAQTGTYEHGRQVGNWKNYFPNGQLSEVLNFDTEGELDGLYQDYEDDGKLAAERQYEHSRTVSIAFFDKAGQALARTSLGKGSVVVKELYPSGSLSGQGTYEDGYRAGEWRFLRRDGTVRLVREYRNGEAHGRSDAFFRNGQLESRQQYQEGTLEGPALVFYADGVLRQTGYYRNGQQEGPWKDYYADGTLSEEYNLRAGESQGIDYSYSPTGRRTEERRSQDGRLLAIAALDSTGRVLDRVEMLPATTSYTLHYPNGKARLTMPVSCYQRQGTSVWLRPDGRQLSVANYQQGIAVGLTRTFHPNGKVNTEGAFVGGKREGQWTAYYESGQVRFKGRYHQDDEAGEWTYYFENGRPDVVLTYQEGVLHGSNRQYNPAGELVLERLYDHGDVVQYRAQASATGQPTGALQPLPTGAKYSLRTQYANGRVAAEETYVNSSLDGVRTLYYSSGQVYRRSQNQAGLLTGLLTTYYPNGQKLEEEYYLHDELHGRCRYYRANGTLEREETYRAGEKAGPTVYYGADGKPLRTEFYWNNYVYSTK